MIALIIKALSDSLLQALFGFIQSELHDRGLIQQGQQQQHAADLEATVKDAVDAAATEDAVRKLPDAQLDAGLERVRGGPGGPG